MRRNAVLQPGGGCLRLPHASAIPDPRHVSGVARSSTYGSGTGDADAPSEQDDPDRTRTASRDADRNLLKELRRNHWRLASPEARAHHEATMTRRRNKRRVSLTCPTCKTPFSRIGSQIHGALEDACCTRRCAALHVTARGIRPRPFRARPVPVVVRSAPPHYEAPPRVFDYEDVPFGVGTMESRA